MSKIICDICGTTYDDSTGPCPVCGWNPGTTLDPSAENIDDIMNDDYQLDEEEPDAAPQRGKAVFDYDAVNTGRPRPRPAAPQPSPIEDEEEEEETGSNKFLVFVLVVLILALLAVSVYIAYTKLWKPNQKGSESNKPQDVITAQPVDVTTEPTFAVGDDYVAEIPTDAPAVTVPTIPCTELSLVSGMDKLTFKGQYWRLLVKYAPEDTTDKVTYTSGNESVVTVDEFGRVTAVGEGETVIVISCGDKRIETPAVVSFASDDSQTATEAPAAGTSGTTAGTGTVATPTSGTLKLKKSDITLIKRGLYITLELENGIAAESVKWSTSDSSVATVYNGNVTAMGRGICTIRAEYNGQVAECVVRCNLK